MTLIQYGCYEDIETLLIKDKLIKDFKKVYEYFDRGYRELRYEIKVEEIISGDIDSLEKYMDCRFANYMYEDCDDESVIESLRKICTEYDIKGVYLNDKEVY